MGLLKRSIEFAKSPAGLQAESAGVAVGVIGLLESESVAAFIGFGVLTALGLAGGLVHDRALQSEATEALSLQGLPEDGRMMAET